MRLIAFIEQTLVARRILEHLGLPARAPTPFPARAPPSPAVDQLPGLDQTPAHPCSARQDATLARARRCYGPFVVPKAEQRLVGDSRLLIRGGLP